MGYLARWGGLFRGMGWDFSRGWGGLFHRGGVGYFTVMRVGWAISRGMGYFAFAKISMKFRNKLELHAFQKHFSYM